jgi:riboflavin kinase/FMN adenylyltransferase
MRIYTQLDQIPQATTPVVATIGNFDGVHLGHRSVIDEVIARAHFLSGLSLAITFAPHPARVLRPEQPFPLITPLPRKLELLAETGIDATLVLPFTESFCHMSARDFATNILRDGIHATEVHEGENFRFGYRAEAGIEGLGELGRDLGFTVRSYAPRTLRGGPISSSRIRTLLTEGQVSAVRALLGCPFVIDSTPASGRGYGARYTVPTINLAPYAELLPAHGVYITTLKIGAGDRAETFEAVTNIGNRPTFGTDSFAAESHLLTFLRRLRAEQKFPTPELLRAQILRDVVQAKRYFRLCKLLAS